MFQVARVVRVVVNSGGQLDPVPETAQLDQSHPHRQIYPGPEQKRDQYIAPQEIVEVGQQLIENFHGALGFSYGFPFSPGPVFFPDLPNNSPSPGIWNPGA